MFVLNPDLMAIIFEKAIQEQGRGQIRDDEEGKISTAYDLFVRAHSHNGKITDKKAEEIKKVFESRKAQAIVEGGEFDEDELFVEVVDGFQNGRLYGIGSALDYYFKKAPSYTSSPTDITSNSYVGVGFLSRIQVNNAKVLEDNAKVREENAKVREENRRMNETILKMQKQLDTLMKIFNA